MFVKMSIENKLIGNLQNEMMRGFQISEGSQDVISLSDTNNKCGIAQRSGLWS